MTAVVADTHTVAWMVLESPRLSAKATAAIRATNDGGFPIYVSSVSIAEMVYAIEKRRMEPIVLESILSGERRKQLGLRVISFSAQMAARMQDIPRSIVPDFPDRMIAAVALELQLPLITVDAKIHQSGITVIW